MGKLLTPVDHENHPHHVGVCWIREIDSVPLSGLIVHRVGWLLFTESLAEVYIIMIKFRGLSEPQHLRTQLVELEHLFHLSHLLGQVIRIQWIETLLPQCQWCENDLEVLWADQENVLPWSWRLEGTSLHRTPRTQPHCLLDRRQRVIKNMWDYWVPTLTTSPFIRFGEEFDWWIGG